MRAYRQLGVERPLSVESVAYLNAEIQTAGDSCRAELVEQRAPLREVRVQTIAHLKVTGADATLAVDWDDVDTMRAAFSTAHRRRFGFLAAEANLVIESVRVEAIGEQAGANATTLSATSIPAAPLRQTTQIFVDEAWREATVRTRANLTVDERIDGPALIIDATSTTIVEPGWSLTLLADEQIELTRPQPAERLTAYETDADPVLLEVFNSHFMNVAEQMGAVLENTAHSVNIKERLDFSCALFDRDGNLIANAPHVPVHLGSMGDSVQAIARDNANDLRPGNAYLLNTPYNGGSHLPDMTVVSPVFDVHDDRLLFFVACRAHHADIGGLTPGSMPPRSRSIHEEGVLFDNFLLVEEGRLREVELRAALGSGPYPARNPDQNVADLSAQLAANEKGANELRAMLEHFGTKAVHAYMEHVQANAEACVRAVIDRLDDGECSLKLDNGATIAVRIRVDSKRREASIDFTGTSAQSANNFNAPVAVTRAAMLYVFRTLVDENIPLNAGCLIPLKLKVPDQSLLSPGYPAAVVAGNVETSQCVTNALYGALGTLAGSQGTMNNLTFGNAQHQYYETICGGAGAGPTFAGASAVHTAMTNSRMTDPEVLEARYPVRVCEFSVRRGSGGNGRYRGGDGVMRKLEFLEPMQAAILSNNRTTQPRGQSGGEPGQAGRNAVLHPDGSLTEHGPVAEFEVEPGDILIIETPGGGGWGKSEAR
jgi:5-oxoprolinase (ATP-hydrolysing)